MTRLVEGDVDPEDLPEGRIVPGDSRMSEFQAPEWGSDEYLLQKWAKLLPQEDIREYRLVLAKMLEYQALYKKTPLQILAEEGNRE